MCTLGVQTLIHAFTFFRAKMCEYFPWETSEAQWLGEVVLKGVRVPTNHLLFSHSNFTSDGCQLVHLLCPVSLLQITS